MSKRYRHRQFKLFGRWFSFTRFDGMTRIHWWRHARIDGDESNQPSASASGDVTKAEHNNEEV